MMSASSSALTAPILLSSRSTESVRIARPAIETLKFKVCVAGSATISKNVIEVLGQNRLWDSHKLRDK